MKKKLIASITCLCLLLVMLLSSTLAWFTDTEMSHNTMTVGNVEIKQYEKDRDGNDFKQNQKLFPAVIVTKDSNGDPEKDANGLWTDSINGEIDKIVTVKNTGDDPAYVRTVFAFEMMWNGTIWEDPIDDEIILNDGREIIFDPSVIIYRYITNGAGNKAQYYYSAEDLGTADAAFVVGVATYFDDPNTALAAGDTTAPSLRQFYLAEDVGNDFYDAVKQQYEILVLSQAMQHAGFETMGINKAMEKAFGTYNAENAAMWFGTGDFIIPGGNGDVAVNGSPVDSTDSEYALRGFDVDMFNGGTGDKIASMCVPTSALKNGDARNFQATMTKTEDGRIVVTNGLEKVSYDIEVNGLVDGNTHELKVKILVGKGMDPSTFAMYHNDTKIDCTYDPNTGYVTFRTASFSPFTVVYDKDSFFVPTGPVDPQPGKNPEDLPKANVVNSTEHENVDLEWGSYGQWSPTEGLDSQLEAAYTFSCVDTLDEAKASPYAEWYCDFVVVLDKALPENSIFLGGNYGSFGWIGFHNGDLTLEANTEIPLLGSVTSNPWTYVDVVQNVGTFICGVGDVDNALAGATFTVMLRLTNHEDETEFYNVATIEYTFASPAQVATAEDLQDAIENGATNIELIDDIDLEMTSDTFITVPKNATVKLDLNGHNIIAASTSAVNTQLFSVSGNLEIVGEGTISLTNPDFAWTTSARYTAINIRETGVVTLGKGVEVVCTAGENTADGYAMTYAVDIYTTGTLNVNGAFLHSNYIAVRCFFGDSVVNVNSGYITSSRNNWGIWKQSADNAKITVADGIAYTTDEYGIYIFG